MKKLAPLCTLLAFGLFIFFQNTLLAQGAENHEHEGNMNQVILFGILELPFLFLCVFYSFKTAAALRGGIFGKGMNYLAWGFLVMAVGHIAMQIDHIWGFDVFTDVFGYVIGRFLWFAALIITWGLSLFGFYSIYKVSKQE